MIAMPSTHNPLSSPLMPQSSIDAAKAVQSTTAAVIVPGQHLLDRAGAFGVFKIEVDCLRRLGWKVHLLVVAPTFHRRRAAARALAEICSAAAELRVDQVEIVSRTRPISALFSTLRLVIAKATRRWGLAADLAISNVLDIADRSTESLVICNYLSGLRLADSMAPGERQIVVLHDVPRGEMRGNAAAALWGRPHLVALTSDDASVVDATVQGARCLAGLPIAHEAPLRFSEMSGANDLGELLDAAAPQLAPPGGWRCSSWVDRPSLDLLFVGSAHPPNVEGLATFLESCFTPHLAAKGVNLVVAGSAGTALGASAFATGVTCLGRVQHLRSLYAAARLVIVPLGRGSGVSIKSIEAIAFGKPVVASAVGLRGLLGARDAALAWPPDRNWVKEIERLLASRLARRRLRDTLAGMVRQRSLSDVLGEMVSSIDRRGRIATGEDASSSAAPRSPLTEWIGGPTPTEAMRQIAIRRGPSDRLSACEAELAMELGWSPEEFVDALCDLALEPVSSLLSR